MPILTLERGREYPGPLVLRPGTPDDPFVVAAASGDGPPPVVVPATSGGPILRCDPSEPLRHVRVQGVRFANVYQDESDPRYTGVASKAGLVIGGPAIDRFGDVHFIGCEFDRVFVGLDTFSLPLDAAALPSSFNECVWHHTFNAAAHCQGLYSSGWPLSVVSCLAWACGYGPDRPPTIFNHGFYVDDLVDIAGCALIGNSSAGIKVRHDAAGGAGGTIAGNLILDHELGITAGGNAVDGIEPAGRFSTLRIVDNVLSGPTTAHTGRSLWWAIQVEGADGADVIGNLITSGSAPPSNTFAVWLDAACSDIDVLDNVVWHLPVGVAPLWIGNERAGTMPAGFKARAHRVAGNLWDAVPTDPSRPIAAIRRRVDPPPLDHGPDATRLDGRGRVAGVAAVADWSRGMLVPLPWSTGGASLSTADPHRLAASLLAAHRRGEPIGPKVAAEVARRRGRFGMPTYAKGA